MATSGRTSVLILLGALVVVGGSLWLGIKSLTPETVPEAELARRGAGRDDTKSPIAPTTHRDRESPGAAVGADLSPRPQQPERPGDVDDGRDDLPDAPSPPSDPGTVPDKDDQPTDDELPGDAPPPPPSRPAPTGELDRETVMAGIRAVKPKIQACFEEGLKRDPSLAGKVTLSFEIEAQEGEGRILTGEVKDAETLSPFFEACVLAEVAKARFDAPRGGGKVKVTYPFLFDPGGGFGGEAPNANDADGDADDDANREGDGDPAAPPAP